MIRNLIRALPTCVLLGLLVAGPAAAQADTVVHDPPHDLALDAREPGRIQLVWVPAEDNRGVTVRAYHVWRREGGGAWEQLASTAPDVTWYSDRRLTGGEAYSYRVVSEAASAVRVALTVEQTRRQSESVGPVLALEPWYVSVERVTPTGGPAGPEGGALVRIHRWLADTGAWDTCLPFGVRTGAALAAQGLEGEFQTGATLAAVWEAEAEGGGEAVGWIRYRLEDGRELQLSTLDAPPEAVWKDAPPKRKRRAPPPAEEETRERPPATPAPAAPTAPRPLRFPEPVRVEEVEGSKVLWEIVNETPFPLSVYYDGPTSGRSSVEPGATIVLRLSRGGDYEVFGRVSSSDRVNPVDGQFSLQSGWRYRSTFIVTQTPPGRR